MNQLDVKVTWGITNKKIVPILTKINSIGLIHHGIKILVNYGLMGKSPKRQPLEFCRYCPDKRIWFGWGNIGAKR
jgi:hypothetical protein